MAAAATRNLLGQPYQVIDVAGVLTTDEYDFKGNAVSTSRQFTADYRSAPDWSAPVGLEPEVFTSRTAVDALNRPVSQHAPDGSTVRRTYSEAGLLATVDAELLASRPPDGRSGRRSSPTSTTTPRVSGPASSTATGS